MAVYSSVLDLIGNTPIIDVSQLSPNPAVRILGKLEGQPPAGSVKDRNARAMLAAAAAAGTVDGLRAVHLDHPRRDAAGVAAVPATAIDGAVARPPADAAAPAPDAAGEDPREAVREKMADFAENHEYLAILQIADLAPTDPVAQQLVADAKEKYVAEQAEAIAGQVRIGACKKAKQLAEAAQKNVPGDTTLAARAAACKPHVETAPETTATIMKKAGDAFGKKDYAAALALAQKVLDKEASNEGALRLATLSSCSLQDAKQARVYYLQLNQADRNYALAWCEKQNIVPTGEPEAPSGPPPEVKAELVKAGAALAQGDDKTAAAIANRVLKTAPRNAAALTIVGIVACQHGDAKTAQSVLHRMPPRKQRALRSTCERNGVPLTE